MINPELDARIATWQAAWMDLHRMPVYDPREAQQYRERSAHLLGIAYVLLSDARHDSDASASVMDRIPAPAGGVPYPLQITPEAAADQFPQRFAYSADDLPAVVAEQFRDRGGLQHDVFARRDPEGTRYPEGSRPAEARP